MLKWNGSLVLHGKGAGATALAMVVLAGCSQPANLGPVADLNAAKAIRETLTSEDAAAAATDAAAATGTGWATLRGQFVYDGTPPQREPYNVTKEHGVCTDGGRPPLQETLVVDEATKGIKNVAVYLRNASRVHDSAAPQNATVVFDQKQCVFLTHVLAALIGDTLEIKNSDPTGHNTNILGSGFNQLIPQGAAIPYKIQKESATPQQVVCSIHPWMVAYILPRKDGYVAVTNEQGRFEISNLPAGEPIELQVWHEVGTAAGNGLVGKTPNAPEISWSNRGRMTVTLQPDEVKEIQISVPPNAFGG